MKIRIARKSDVINLVLIFKQYNTFLDKLTSKKRILFNKPKYNQDEVIEKSIEKRISSKKQKILVAEENGKIIGSISGWINTHEVLGKKYKIGTLGYLIVDKEFQKKGISSKLKDELFNWFKKEDCKFITLEVNSNNPAKKIYEKWNFKTYYEKMLIKL